MAKVKKQSVKIEEKENNESFNETELLKTQLARTLADYDNLRRRTEEEKIQWIKFSSQTIIIKLLSVLDMIEKAQEHLKDQGLAIAVLEFKKVLNEEGVEEIMPKVGDVFDHELHEAIETVDGEEKNSISEILVSGWRYKDGQVIRFAKVKVIN